MLKRRELNKQWIIICGGAVLVYGFRKFYQYKMWRTVYKQEHDCYLDIKDYYENRYETLKKMVKKETTILDRDLREEFNELLKKNEEKWGNEGVE